MRVLLIDKTGVMDSAHERCCAIAAHDDIDLHLLTPTSWFEAGQKVFLPERESANYTTHSQRAGFQGNYARGFYWGGMTEVVRKCQPDIIQLLEEPWSLFALQAMIARKKAAPDSSLLFYTWENIYREISYPARVSWPYRMIDRRSYEESNGAVCATEAACEVLSRKGFSKPVAVIPYGVDSTFIDAATLDKNELRSNLNLPQGFLVGYVGRLLKMKGVDLLINAVSGIPEARLVIVGTGPEKEPLRMLADSLGVSDRVTFVGPVDHEKMPSYMRAIDCLVLPSRTTSNWKEQLGRVLIESMAVGTVAIGSSSGAIPEVLGDSGLVFKEDDQDDLAEKIKAASQDSALREILSGKGRTSVGERFTWERFAADLASFWRSL